MIGHILLGAFLSFMPADAEINIPSSIELVYSMPKDSIAKISNHRVNAYFTG